MSVVLSLVVFVPLSPVSPVGLKPGPSVPEDLSGPPLATWGPDMGQMPHGLVNSIFSSFWVMSWSLELILGTGCLGLG